MSTLLIVLAGVVIVAVVGIVGFVYWLYHNDKDALR